MRITPGRLLVATALLVVPPLVAGCSTSSTSGTTTTTTTNVRPPSPTSTSVVPSTTTTPSTAPTTTTTTAAAGAAVGSAGGVTVSVTSSPRSGTLGHTQIAVTAVVTGTVVPSRLDFLVSDSPSSDQGQPATDQPLAITGPGTYSMPQTFAPTAAGTWAASVVYSPNGTSSTISVSGLPPHAGQPAPFPQLVTVVTG